MRLLRFTLLSVAILIVFPFVLHLIGGYGGLATQILIMAIAALGFNILLGYAGVLSYGHAMFYGAGGYVAALVLLKFLPGTNLWIALVLATAFVALASLVVGALVVRLYGIYFALLTVAFAQMMYFIVFQWRDLTGGDNGLQSIPNPNLPFFGLNIDLTTPLPAIDLGPFGNLSDLHLWYVFVAILVLLVLVFSRAFVDSQFGEVLGAIRENEERSTFVGYNPALYKLAAFVLSGALAGVAGALRAVYDGSVAVDTLTIDTSGNFVIYVIIGGVQTLFGPLLGTGIIMYLQNVLSAKTESWRLIEGLIFVAVIVFMPKGILGTIRSWRSRGKATPSFSLAQTLRVEKS